MAMAPTTMMIKLLLFVSYTASTLGMFKSITDKGISSDSNPSQLNYGVAITDVDGEEGYEVVVAGYDGPNLVLKWNNVTKQLDNIAVSNTSSPYYGLRDVGGQAIGVTACDVDGDGREEIYFLNTNSAYSGKASYPDKLFKWRNGKYEDIFSDEINEAVSSYSAGRSVGCIDRFGTGKYGVYLANYASGDIGAHDIIEIDAERSDVKKGIIALKSVGLEAGVSKLTGGRGVTVGPIVTNRSDIFCDNERGPNFLFKNQGNGTFKDIAGKVGIEDKFENGRGVALSDFNDDGRIDIVYGNWNGPHRLFLQESANEPSFKNVAGNSNFSKPSPIRTVIAADFDNDGNQELFLNNIAYRGPAPNSVHTVRKGINDEDTVIEEIDIGDAIEENGKGTGGAVVDLDGDGVLELVLSHGESGKEPLTLYKVDTISSKDNNWIRVAALTSYGSPARGAKVSVTSSSGVRQSRVIDAGSGYLCQMEPVAHFGLGIDNPEKVEVLFPDGTSVTKNLNGETNKVIKIKQIRKRQGKKISQGSKPITNTIDKPKVCPYSDLYTTLGYWGCEKWKASGFCQQSSEYFSWMMSNCQRTCMC